MKKDIEIEKVKGLYRGRKVGTQETKQNFIEKPRNQKILNYLEKGYPYNEICKIIGCSFSTINKVKRTNLEIKRSLME